MKKKRYLIIGGNVISKSDGQEHYVTANQLFQLYKVPAGADYRLVDEWNKEKLQGLNQKEFIILEPRYDGNYTLNDLI